MSWILPIKLETLLEHRIEDERLEFKATWDEYTRTAVLETVCAFANDLHHLNGGYLLLGVEEGPDKRATRPVRGLLPDQIDKIQQQLRGLVRSQVTPECAYLINPAELDGRLILALHVPGRGRVLRWLGRPMAEWAEAFHQAARLLPTEPRVTEEARRLAP